MDNLLFRSNFPKTLQFQLNWLPASQPKLEPIGIVIVGDVNVCTNGFRATIRYLKAILTLLPESFWLYLG